MANKYLALILGKKKEVEFIISSAGAGDSGKGVAVGSDGRLNLNMMPVGITPEVKVCPAYENLSAGNFINLFSDSGTLKARKTDAGTNKYDAHGFVLSPVTAPADATVYLEGNNTGLSGMTVGALQFLAETAGARTESPISGAGKINQRLGIAVSATEMTFEPDDPEELA